MIIEDNKYRCECGRVFNSHRALKLHSHSCSSCIIPSDNTKTCRTSYYKDNIYRCECGYTTDNYQSLNGHSHYCKEHRAAIGKDPESIM